MPDDAPSYEQLVADNAALREENAELRRVTAELSDRVAELERRLSGDSANSARPPSSDAPWEKKPAKKGSSRGSSGRKPGKQSGASSSSRSLVDDPDERFDLVPDRCQGCDSSLADAAESHRDRRQVVDAAPPPPPTVTEYRRIAKVCGCCGAVTMPDWQVGDQHAATVTGPGSPVRIGPSAAAYAALLTCGHHLPVGRSRQLLEALCAIDVSTGFVASIRGRAARKLEQKFQTRLRELPAGTDVLHADETTGRAAGTLSYVHVACTEYLTLMHVGGRSAADIDAGGVLPAFTGTRIRDGYVGYSHLDHAAHAWCGAHLLRDLRSIAEADPDGQVWAEAMANTLIEARDAALEARHHGAEALTTDVASRIRHHYRGALARAETDNQHQRNSLTTEARTLATRFRRYEDMILRFATDLSVPFTNNEAERAVRPVKVQQRTSGGCWRTLQGLADFALVQSYLDTATKCGRDKLDVLRELFTTGAWLPQHPPQLNSCTFTCVLALQIAHLMRHQARQAGLHLTVRALLAELAGIQETVLLYQGAKGHPKARRMLTDTTGTQDRLSDQFGLNRYAPARP